MDDATVPSGGKAGEICETCPKNFIIILGGPGIFHPKDTSHDRTWRSYFLTMQYGFDNDQIPDLEAKETVHWLVYGPAYTARWIDDYKPDDNQWDNFLSRRTHDQEETRDLHSEQVIDSGSDNYMDNIKRYVNSLNGKNSIKHKFVSIGSSGEAVSYMNALQDLSITRLWYAGHAVAGELWLTLEHAPATDSEPLRATIVEPTPPDMFKANLLSNPYSNPHVNLTPISFPKVEEFDSILDYIREVARRGNEKLDEFNHIVNEYKEIEYPKKLKEYQGKIITVDDLQAVLSAKTDPSQKKMSYFIGCNTSRKDTPTGTSSAETWATHTGLQTYGFDVTMHFGEYTKLCIPNSTKYSQSSFE